MKDDGAALPPIADRLCFFDGKLRLELKRRLAGER